MKKLFSTILVLGFLCCLNANAKPPFKSMVLGWDKMINKDDPTTFEKIEYKDVITVKGIDERTGWKGKDQFYAKFKAHVFKVTYKDNTPTNIQVNYEIKKRKKAEDLALKLGKAFGQLPKFLRKNINTITINKGTMKARAWDKEISIFTNSIDETIEELLLHEAAHITIDWDQKNTTVGHINFSSKWKSAQSADNEYISKYAKTLIGKKWRLEDVSESIMAWIYIKCKSDRIPKKKYDKIVKTIPNRIKYFDIQNYDLYPMVCN